MQKRINQLKKNKEGAALLVAIMVLLILGLIIGSFAFEVNLEAMLVSYKRKKWRAEMMAHSGLEYARAILDEQAKAKQLEIEDLDEDKDGFMQDALFVQRGLAVNRTFSFDDGSEFTIAIESAEAGRNINLLTRDQWLDIFEMANVPNTDWDAMIDCLIDWTDESDEHQLNGAESDDPFYQDAGYPVKNGPLDSVEELLLIKNWGPEILYGKPADEESDEIFGIYDILTVWGDGKVNLNTASEDLLLSYSEYEDWELESVFEARMGEDMEAGTLDDGIRSLEQVGADAGKFKLQSSFVKVTSVGDIYGQQYQIEAIFLMKSKDSVVVYWNEGPVKQNK
ncbi:general secretion pathway protein GspK [Pontiella agarivorans]|uniref:Type II secretion system protein GspK n=1 Tax=Pontiella agarivorans TaxID=3038953 RepID=A0ABU5MUJ4_9BACT|nr:type II secretion system protein GspK [Pontiella agarivorans]MDZ8117858.1 type II secretion system protein GspK [Pontiella agarivorans]